MFFFPLFGVGIFFVTKSIYLYVCKAYTYVVMSMGKSKLIVSSIFYVFYILKSDSLTNDDDFFVLVFSRLMWRSSVLVQTLVVKRA